jgi:hypothetical protein
MQTNECPADSTGALFSLVHSEKGVVDDLRSKSITGVRAIAAEPNARSTRRKPRFFSDLLMLLRF